MSHFGDIELADAWDLEPTIAPEQLAMRLHLLRRLVDELVGIDTPDWDDLELDDQDEEIVVATEAIVFIGRREPDNPALLAEHIHETRNGHAWDNLSNDERQIAIDLTTAILQWLESEGPR